MPAKSSIDDDDDDIFNFIDSFGAENFTNL